MKRIVTGISPNEYVEIVNQNFDELSQMNSIDTYEYLTLTDDGSVQSSKISVLLSNAFNIGDRGYSRINSAFVSSVSSFYMVISDYQNSNDYINVSWPNDTLWSVESGYQFPENYTTESNYYTLIERGHAIRQDCYIKQIKISVNSYIDEAQWKFKLFYLDGSEYKCKYEEAFTVTKLGTNTINLAGFIHATIGDIVGIYIPPKCSINFGRDSNKYDTEPRYCSGDVLIGNGDSFIKNANRLIESGWANVGYALISAYSERPYAIFIGDSIFGGGNGYTSEIDGNEWIQDQETSMLATRTPGGAGSSGGDINLEVAHRFKLRMPVSFKYQNFSKGGSTYGSLVSTNAQLDKAKLVTPKVVFIHCGINDLIFNAGAPIDVNTIISNLDTIVQAFPDSLIFIDEVLPATNRSSEENVRINNLNVALLAFSLENGVNLVNCHDEMAIINETTGLLTEINPIYQRGDGLHLSLLGVDKLAELIYNKFITAVNV